MPKNGTAVDQEKLKIIQEMQADKDKQFATCPYRTVVRTPGITYQVIEERFDFQIGENGKIERVSLGLFDLAKEINSHKNEVGLKNVLAIAEGRGISLDTFAKTEPGIMADIGDIDTFDDLLTAKQQADEKLASIAKVYGITVEQLVAAVKNGEQLTPVADKATEEVAE